MNDAMRRVTMCLASAALLGAAPPARRCGPAVGSAPTIMAALAPGIVALADGRAALAAPFRPPQGSLDPKLAAFLSGQTNFALLTRELAEPDLALFRASHGGRDPLILPVAAGNWNRFGYVDAVVVIVHRANPVEGLSLAQVDAIFSSSRWRGHAPVATWGDLGVAGPLAGTAIRLAGGDAWASVESARALFVRRRVLNVGGRVGRWRPGPGTGGDADVVARVGRDPAAIGLTGMGHLGADVRPLPIDGVALSAASAHDGSYPLLRTVDLLTDAPAGRIDRRVWRLAAALLSRHGQRLFARQGDLASLPPPVLADARRMLNGLKPVQGCP